jgi:DNA-binding HxlR family transcriptional regulator
MNIDYETFMQIIADSPDTPEGQEKCPVSRTLEAVRGKWKEQILFFLCKKGVCRFNEIHKAYPQISKTMLSSVLKQLEADGLVVRRQYDEMPVRTEYSLTEAGEAFMPIFFEMFRWGMKYRPDPELDAALSEEKQ